MAMVSTKREGGYHYSLFKLNHGGIGPYENSIRVTVKVEDCGGGFYKIM